ncbi:MalY/PatB family protein [Planctomycetota bacterium]
MKYDFDSIVDRRQTGSVKWDKYAGRDILPLWVADMDFRCPPAVLEALRRRIDHGVFGYSVAQEELVEIVVARLKAKYNWQIERDWLVWLPGVMPGINIACRCIGGDGDEVMCFVPAYPPFLTAPSQFGRQLKTVPLSRRDNKFYMDPERFKEAVTSRSKLLILCNPHNPVGREYDAKELKTIAQICLANGIIICSDEIHCDLILDEIKHIPTATLSPEIAQNTITLLSSSKTFNTPGLNCGLAIIPNEKIREIFSPAAARTLPDCNALGLVAALAAYRDGEEWRQELIQYLRQNRDIVTDYVNNQIPLLSMDHIEATYLAWINITKLEVTDPAGFFENAGVGLSDGRFFQGPGYVRLNFGCSRKILLQALERMKKAVEKKIKAINTPLNPLSRGDFF